MTPIPEDLLRDEIGEEEEKKKKKKEKASPFSVYVILFSTLAFSFIFFAYRKVDNFIKSGQALSPQVDLKFNLQTVSFYFKKITGGLPTNLSAQDIEKNLQELLKDNIRNWSIHVEVYPNSTTGSSRFWSYNKDGLQSYDPANVLHELKSQLPQVNSFLAQDLPQGIIIKQNYVESNQNVRLDVLLSVPTKDMLITILVQNQLDISKTKALLPKVISTIYWSFAGLE